MSLFEAAGLAGDLPVPLAERLRPTSLGDVVGQKQLLGESGKLRVLLASRGLPSIILYGPPGTGKTTIARLLAEEKGLVFEQLSAIFSGVADLKRAFAAAETRRSEGKATLLFVDELHRFDKRQQDSFLPHMETGLITLVGATTENPSFALNRALLSRAVALKLERLSAEDCDVLLARAERELGASLPLTADGRACLIAMADGDGRALLALAEQVIASAPAAPLDADALRRSFQGRAAAGDRGGDVHYDFASVLQKAIRGSDDDAALYWTARMLDAGEDPMFIFRLSRPKTLAMPTRGRFRSSSPRARPSASWVSPRATSRSVRPSPISPRRRSRTPATLPSRRPRPSPAKQGRCRRRAMPSTPRRT